MTDPVSIQVDELNAQLGKERAEHRETRKKLRAAKAVQLVAEMRAGPMRLEAVRHRNFDGTEGKITFSMVFDNDIMAHMGESAAQLFSRFVTDTLERSGSDVVAAPAEAPAAE
jgi:hypothetical protein